MGQRAGPQGFRDGVPLRCHPGGSWEDFGVNSGKEDEPVSQAGHRSHVTTSLMASRKR